MSSFSPSQDLSSTQLIVADPAAWPVASGWQSVVDEFFAGKTGQQLLGFLQQRLNDGAALVRWS